MNRDNNIFTVTNNDLNLLEPAKAVWFFRELLWAEARRLGIGLSQINVPIPINVPDGGVDATVNADLSATGSDIIKPGKNCYQIKSGQAFKPWQESVTRKELFGSDTPLRETLGEGIRACLDANGTYVLVCTGIDLVDKQHRNVLTHLNEDLKSCGYQNPRVEVWSQNTLIGFLQRFPSLTLRVNGRSKAQFQTHQSWARNDDMSVEFVPGQAQEDLISQIRDDLRRNDDTVHVRVRGEPGIGKTRLVLEATRADDLAPLVVYCKAARFRNRVLMDELLWDDNQFAAILVIDECDLSSSFDIWNELRRSDARIKLVTISNDYETKTGDITYPDTPPLDNEQIRQIITPPLDNEQIRQIIQGDTSNPDFHADRWAEICSGSPRVAHVITENLRSHPEDVLKPPGTVDIWGRYVAGNDDLRSLEVRQPQRVLRHLALFKRFGFAGKRSVVDEARSIAKKAEVPWIDFQEIVEGLRDRKILQGDFTLYITPKALHIKLWTEWWDTYGTTFNLEEFTRDLTPELVEWFYEMFRYAAESEAASRIVKDLLGPDGPFRDGDYLMTRLGSRFFSALTEADPKAALKCLMRTLGTWDKETLLQFTGGRRNVIWALEKIAVWRDLFADAARLLLALGEAENEGCSNNASGVFAALFSPARGRVAPTEASPEERLPVLKEAFESGSKERRTLALKACNVALESRRFSRIGGPEYQGLRKEPEFWTPKTYGEIFDAYRRVWNLLAEQLASLPEEERKCGADILLQQARALGRISNLSDMVVDTLQMLSAKALVDEKQLIKTVVEFLRSADKDLPAETRQRWEQLSNTLVPEDFHSLMRRYVGMALHSDLFDENENYLEQGSTKVHSLAQQTVETPSLLHPELQWLVTTEAQNGGSFGYALGKRDDGFSLLPRLLDTQRDAGENASGFFLGGYFRAIFESDVTQWEKYLDAVSEDTVLNALVPELIQYSGMTDRAGLLLLDLAKRGIISVNNFSRLAPNSLSDEVFTAWIEFLLGFTDKSVVSIALDLYHRYYIFRKSAPTLSRDLTFRLLSHPSLFEGSDGSSFNPMETYHWSEITKAFLNLDPKKGLELAKLVLNHFGEEGSIFNYDSDICAVLTEITKRYPAEVWDHVSKLLENQNFSRTVALERWLADGESSEEGAFAHIPLEKIWEWVDGAPEKRAVYLAHRLVLTPLSAATWPTSLERGLLVRYGNVAEDLGGTLMSNYTMGGWAGPSSWHYGGILEELLRIKTDEDNENVKRWIDEYVDSLEQDYIEPAKMDEERMSL